MFENFSHEAHRTVVDARGEADKLGKKYIGVEHLVLALTRREDYLVTRALLDQLEENDKSLADLQNSLSKVKSPSARKKPGTAGPVFNSEAKSALKYAHDQESPTSGNKGYVTTEGLLVAILEDRPTETSRVLRNDFGVTRKKFEEYVELDLADRIRRARFKEALANACLIGIRFVNLKDSTVTDARISPDHAKGLLEALRVEEGRVELPFFQDPSAESFYQIELGKAVFFGGPLEITRLEVHRNMVEYDHVWMYYPGKSITRLLDRIMSSAGKYPARINDLIDWEHGIPGVLERLKSLV